MSFKHLFDVQGPRARLFRPTGQTAKSRNRFSGEHPIIGYALINNKGGCHSL